MDIPYPLHSAASAQPRPQQPVTCPLRPPSAEARVSFASAKAQSATAYASCNCATGPGHISLLQKRRNCSEAFLGQHICRSSVSTSTSVLRLKTPFFFFRKASCRTATITAWARGRRIIVEYIQGWLTCDVEIERNSVEAARG